MYVTQDKAKQEKHVQCQHGGAMVGDTILFSSHSPANDYLPRHLQTNKPYVVHGLDSYSDGTIVGRIIDEEGDQCTIDVGSYDVIIRDEQKPVEAVFQPVHIVLESRSEVLEASHAMKYSLTPFGTNVYQAIDRVCNV